jgi:integrase
MKGTANQIKLPTLVLDILKEQPRIEGNPYVFPGAVSGRPFNAFSLGMNEIRALLPEDMPTWSMHDLRRTARKLMTRARIRTDVAEIAIGHSIKGIQALYDDVQEYQSFIDHAFQCVADELDKIINRPEGNVVPFRA